jgi:hypothetical protein
MGPEYNTEAMAEKCAANESYGTAQEYYFSGRQEDQIRKQRTAVAGEGEVEKSRTQQIFHVSKIR